MGYVIIGLFLLYIVGWIIYSIFKAIVESINDTKKRFVDATVKRKTDAQIKRKKSLDAYVKFHVPSGLVDIEKEIKSVQNELNQAKSRFKLKAYPPTWHKFIFQPIIFSGKRNSTGTMLIEETREILTPASTTWFAEEQNLIKSTCVYPSEFPKEKILASKQEPISEISLGIEEAIFEYNNAKVNQKDIQELFKEEEDAVTAYNTRRLKLLESAQILNDEILEFNTKASEEWRKYSIEHKELYQNEFAGFNTVSKLYINKCNEQKQQFQDWLEEYTKGTKKGVVQRINSALGYIELPRSIPHTWDADFDEQENIAIVEIGLPDVVHVPPEKTVELKSGTVTKPLNQSEKRELVPAIHPAIMLRIAYEIFRNDNLDKIKVLVLNGWVEFDDPQTGVMTKAYTASLMVTKDKVINLNLNKLDPIVAFNGLKGKSAGKIVEIVPITPTLQLNRKDSRFVESKDVLNTLNSELNLAAMDWQDFEHLIRELFERVFEKDGAEVRVTQASRDRGVDAVVFDPDPIKGGKFVIQAKRYTNTVDVSAVRDLCAVVAKEGASRGILVTTSTFGSDAYEFANGAPVTLLNGSQLLGLLKQYGYTFRIDLQEAKKMNIS